MVNSKKVTVTFGDPSYDKKARNIQNLWKLVSTLLTRPSVEDATFFFGREIDHVKTLPAGKNVLMQSNVKRLHIQVEKCVFSPRAGVVLFMVY